MTPAKNGIELDAELTVGDKSEEINTEVGTNSYTQQADQIINSRDIPISWVLLFTILAGWAIPSPQQMGAGILTFLRLLLPWAGRR